MSNDTGGTAFPFVMDTGLTVQWSMGMTLRQYAAIRLRVPESGDAWLDDMIRESVRDELAAKAMQSLILAAKSANDIDMLSSGAYQLADAMIKARSIK